MFGKNGKAIKIHSNNITYTYVSNVSIYKYKNILPHDENNNKKLQNKIKSKKITIKRKKKKLAIQLSNCNIRLTFTDFSTIILVV